MTSYLSTCIDLQQPASSEARGGKSRLLYPDQPPQTARSPHPQSGSMGCRTRLTASHRGRKPDLVRRPLREVPSFPNRRAVIIMALGGQRLRRTGTKPSLLGTCARLVSTVHELSNFTC